MLAFIYNIQKTFYSPPELISSHMDFLRPTVAFHVVLQGHMGDYAIGQKGEKVIDVLQYV